MKRALRRSGAPVHEIGINKVVEQLCVPLDWRQWRNRYSSQDYVASGHKRVSADPKGKRISELEKENRELQRAN